MPAAISLDVITVPHEHRTAGRLERPVRGTEDSDVREPAGRIPCTAGPGFDLTASKLRRPVVRPGTVSRSSLIDRIAREDRCPIVAVVAGALLLNERFTAQTLFAMAVILAGVILMVSTRRRPTP